MKFIGLFLTLVGTCLLIAAVLADDTFFEIFFFGRIGVFFGGALSTALGASCFISGLKEKNRDS